MVLGGPPRDTYTPMAEINVTPMVDVMLVLLVIFMVAAPLMTVGVPLSLPKSDAQKVARSKQPLIVSVDRQGQVFVGADLIAVDALRGTLAARAAADAQQTVLVRGDKAVDYGRVMAVMGQVGQAGFAHVSLLTDPGAP